MSVFFIEDGGKYIWGLTCNPSFIFRVLYIFLFFAVLNTVSFESNPLPSRNGKISIIKPYPGQSLNTNKVNGS